jgi:hypothetical protein
MSLFSGQEKLVEVYHSVDTTAKKVVNYPSTPNFLVRVNLIRRGADVTSFLGDQLTEFIANVREDYLGDETLKESDKVVIDNKEFIIVNKPRYNRLFKRYRINLRSREDGV